MRKTVYLLLLFILLLQSGGMLLFYHVQQFYVQYEIQNVLEKSETQFQKITLPLAQFEKSKISEDEILLGGKMYDVKSVTVIGDNAELLVINDMEEEDIVEKIKKALNKGNHEQQRIPDHITKLSGLIYLASLSYPLFSEGVSTRNYFSLLNEMVISHESETPSPPPKTA